MKYDNEGPKSLTVYVQIMIKAYSIHCMEKVNTEYWEKYGF